MQSHRISVQNDECNFASSHSLIATYDATLIFLLLSVEPGRTYHAVAMVTDTLHQQLKTRKRRTIMRKNVGYYRLEKDDVQSTLAGTANNSFDGLFMDSPYGLSFMEKKWDQELPSIKVCGELLRVAKPGAILLAFGSPRTYHRLACHLEDAGWQIRDCLMWLHGEGFPKSHDLSKAIDKKLGAKRKVVGTKPNPHRGVRADHQYRFQPPDMPVEITIPATPEAELWDGYGTGLKPAWEPILVAMKPRQGSFADNALTWGCGALDIDACRVGTNGHSLGVSQRSYDSDGLI